MSERLKPELIEIGWRGKLEFNVETCCEVCNEPIHTHIDCPACGKMNAPSETYGEPCPEENIECAECGAVFKPTSERRWYDSDLIWELIEKKPYP